MKKEELRIALAENGQMVLNLTRADRALRQIVAMEQEILGLREPPSPHGGFGGRGQDGGSGGGSGKPGEGRHDFNNVNDLNDLKEVSDIHDLAEIMDLGDVEDLEFYSDLKALEKYDNFEEFNRRRKRDWDKEIAKNNALDAELDADIQAELERLEALGPPPPMTDDEHHEAIQDMEAQQRDMLAEAMAEYQEEWSRVRAALLQRRAVEKQARRRRGRGLP